MHKTDGVSFVNPSEILAKLLEAIPKIIPLAKKRYPKNGFIYSFDAILLTKGLINGAKENAAIKAIGYANIIEYPHLKKNPSSTPVFTATTTPLIIILIPNDIKIINKGCAYFLLIMINCYLTG